MADQSLAAWLTPSEGFKHLGWGAAATQAEHGVAETAAGGHDLLLLLQAHLLEGTKGIGAEHLSPLVGVVAGRIAAGKNMAEGAEEGVLGYGLKHRCGGSDMAAQLIRTLTAVRGPLAVQAKVGEGEVHLAQGGAASHEGAGCQQLLVFGLRQWFAALPVACHAHQGGPVVAPVLHELAG